MRPGETGVVIDATDSKLIAETITEMLSDQEKLTSMGKAARQLAKERFDWKQLAEQAYKEF